MSSQAYVRNGVFKIEDILQYTNQIKGYIGEDGITYDIDMNSHRYLCFKKHGISCVNCGLTGTFFAMEKHLGSNNNKYHFNLYAIYEGNEVLMTKDHIIPKSRGGKNHIDNYQTMCVNCNGKKGDGRKGHIPYNSLNKQWALKFIKENELVIGYAKDVGKWFAKRDGTSFIGRGNDFIEATRSFKVQEDNYALHRDI